MESVRQLATSTFWKQAKVDFIIPKMNELTRLDTMDIDLEPEAFKLEVRARQEAVKFIKEILEEIDSFDGKPRMGMSDFS